MSLEKANISWTAKQLGAMVKSGKINFDHIVQRSYVWERSRKSGLIESMIIGYPVPPIFAKRIDDGTGKRGGNIYYIMDGKQRLSTVKEYLNDEFALTTLNPITYKDIETEEEKTVDISEKKYSELPEAVQDILKDTTFSVTYFDSLSDEEERELFKRLNAGKPLSAKSKMLASCRDIKGLMDIGKHEVFTEMLSEKAQNNKNQVSIVAKTHMMAFKNVEMGEVAFDNKTFSAQMEEMSISEAEKSLLIQIYNKIHEVHEELVDRKEKKVAKKLYTETHLVSLVPFFKKATEQDIDDNTMADWLMEFFNTESGTSNSEEYNECSGSGVARKDNVMGRHEALEESFNEFFAEDDDETEDDDEE